MAKKKTSPAQRRHTVALNKEGVASSRAQPKAADMAPQVPAFMPAPPVPRIEPPERLEPVWRDEDDAPQALMRLATEPPHETEAPDAPDAAPAPPVTAAPEPPPPPAPVAVELPPPGEKVLVRLSGLRATNTALAASLARLSPMHASPRGTDQEKAP